MEVPTIIIWRQIEAPRFSVEVRERPKSGGPRGRDLINEAIQFADLLDERVPYTFVRALFERLGAIYLTRAYGGGEPPEEED